MSINFNDSYFYLLPSEIKKMTETYRYGPTSLIDCHYDANDMTTPLKIDLFAPQNILRTYTEYATKLKSLNERKSELQNQEVKYIEEYNDDETNPARFAQWENRTSPVYANMDQIEKDKKELGSEIFKNTLQKNLLPMMIELVGGKEIYDKLPIFEISNFEYFNYYETITPDSMSHSVMRAFLKGESSGCHRILVRLQEGDGEPYVRSYYLHSLSENWSYRAVLDDDNSYKILNMDGPITPTELLDHKELLTKGKNSKGETLV